jgi:hypothetical protein
LRCRAFRQYVHHPERLMYPQKRVRSLEYSSWRIETC